MRKMGIVEIVGELAVWQLKIGEFDAQVDKLAELVGHDSPFMEAMCDIANAYTDTVAGIVGAEYGDECECGAHNLLEWYRLRAEMGRAPQNAELASGEVIAVTDIFSLARLIVEG
jgi:hypothetical protein